MATKFLKAQNGGIYKDSTGKPIAVDMSLPALSNPATAEDIASGKEAYGADGAVITGTAEGYTVVRGTITPTAAVQTINIINIPSEPKFLQITLSGTIDQNWISFVSTNLIDESAYSTNGWRNARAVYFVSSTKGYKHIAPYPGTYDSSTQTVTLDAGSGRYYGTAKYNYVIIY